MEDEHSEYEHPAQPNQKPQPVPGDKNADTFEDFVVKPGIAVGLGWLAYEYLGILGAVAGPGFVAGAAAEKLAKDGNINLTSDQILENMVTGTAMTGAAALGLNVAKNLPNLGLGGTLNAFGYSVSASTLAAGAALAAGASLIAPLVYYPLSYVLTHGKLDGIGKDLKNNYLKGLRTLPISLLGAGAAYAGIFAMSPYIAIPAALYFLAGYRTALSRENWGYMKAVGMSLAAPIAAAGALGSYLIIGVPKAAFQLAYSVINKGSSLIQDIYTGAKDLFDSFGGLMSKPLGKPVPRAAHGPAPNPAAAPAHA